MSAPDAEREGLAALVMRLRGEGIVDKTLLDALEAVPRSHFVPPTHADFAYSARMIPLECGSFMEGADLAVRLVHLLRLHSDHKVLEIGTGSGYTAALAARLAGKVVSIERYRTLVAAAQYRLERFEFQNLACRHGDGSEPPTGEGNFDRILSTAAFDSLPRRFAEQLTSGGEMIAPLIVGEGVARLVRLTKVGSRFEREDLFDVPFLRIVEGVAEAL